MIEKRKDCKHEHGHPGHLCMLASSGKIEEIKLLVKDPQFVCFSCGRVADQAGNLCNPMPLK